MNADEFDEPGKRAVEGMHKYKLDGKPAPPSKTSPAAATSASKTTATRSGSRTSSYCR